MSAVVQQQRVQHCNMNEYRNYPFSEDSVLVDTDGSPLATDIFVDALLYPIVSRQTEISLLRIDFSQNGLVELSIGDDRLLGNGSEDDRCVYLYDKHGRKAGVIVCGDGWTREYGTMRSRTFNDIRFAACTMSQVEYSGVESIVMPDGSRTSRRNIVFSGDDVLTPNISGSSGSAALSFDAWYDPGVTDKSGAVRQLVVAVTGDTIFSIYELGEGSVLLATPELDREDVCWQAHREDSVSTVVDTCEPSQECGQSTVPSKSQAVYVCPNEDGLVVISADDVLGLKNAVHVGIVDGDIVPNTPMLSKDMTESAVENVSSVLTERPSQIGNGIKISIPGI